MSLVEVFLIAVGLAVDAMAVSICKGLSSGQTKIKNMLICGIWFGLFQALMPLIGFMFANIFVNHIRMITPWISFALLVFLGVKTIYDGMKERKSTEVPAANSSYSLASMFALAIATSIDALAIGVTFAFNGVSWNIGELSNIWLCILIIGAVTFIIAACGNLLGSKLGAAFGDKLKFVASIMGGLILCALGVKFLVEGIIDVSALSSAAQMLG